MIDFSDLKIQKTETEFYLPYALLNPMTDELDKAGIPYKAYNNKRVSARDIPNPFVTDEELKEKLQKFKDNGYDEAVFVFLAALIVLPVSENDMFEKSKLFYGPTIDPDYAENDAPVFRDGQKAYEDWIADKKSWEAFKKKHPDIKS